MIETAWDSRQLCVLRLSLRQNRNIGIGSFPKREEILISNLSFRRIAGQRIGAAKTEMR